QREEPGVLVTTIPYEKGWNVTVNGEERDIVQANIGFIGVPLDSGNSEIVFSYQSPYLKSGGVLSLIGIFLLGLIQLIRKKNNPSLLIFVIVSYSHYRYLHYNEKFLNSFNLDGRIKPHQ